MRRRDARKRDARSRAEHRRALARILDGPIDQMALIEELVGMKKLESEASYVYSGEARRRLYRKYAQSLLQNLSVGYRPLRDAHQGGFLTGSRLHVCSARRALRTGEGGGPSLRSAADLGFDMRPYGCPRNAIRSERRSRYTGQGSSSSGGGASGGMHITQ